MSTHVEALLEEWTAGIRQKDIERLMAAYGAEIVYFDCVPPLEIKGLEGVRKNFLRWFDTWNGPIGVELRDRIITQSEDVAAAHMLHRTYGTLMIGREVDYWLRVSLICRRSGVGWRISHEHVSAPVDFAKGEAVLDLEP